MIKYDEPEEGGGNDICVDSNGKPTKTKQPGNGLKSKSTEERPLEGRTYNYMGHVRTSDGTAIYLFEATIVRC